MNYKIIKIAFFSVFGTLSVNNFVFGSDIYFCTKDLKHSISPGLTNEQNVPDQNYINIQEEISNNENTTLRHCFMALGDKDRVIEDSEIKTYLKLKFTVGFFVDDKGNAEFGNDWFDKHTISCTKVRKIENNENEFVEWSKVLTFFKESVKLGYNEVSHNCCSVAYDSISKINGIKTNIDVRSFNLGIGTKWRFKENTAKDSSGVIYDYVLFRSGSPDFSEKEDL